MINTDNMLKLAGYNYFGVHERAYYDTESGKHYMSIIDHRETDTRLDGIYGRLGVYEVDQAYLSKWADCRNITLKLTAAVALGSMTSDKKKASSAANGKKGGRPRGEEMTYELINHDGCLMDTVRTTSFRNAREYFSHNYEGKYVILCGEIDDRRNVVLK